MIRIAITGPESTGKSDLAAALARQYETIWVREFAREYLTKLDRPYEYHDILEIARGQFILETASENLADKILFCDTEFLVTKIWCEVRYGRCHDWIDRMWMQHTYDHYLLCNIDLPWKEDPLREHPHMRDGLFQLYLTALSGRALPFTIISGQGEDRLHNAMRVIDDLLIAE